MQRARKKEKKSVVKFNLKCSGEDKQVGQSGGEENWEERRERGRQDGELVNRSLYVKSCVFFPSPPQHTHTHQTNRISNSSVYCK